ncbi:hypothetical protein [Nonomuraea sp. NPDC002799]
MKLRVEALEASLTPGGFRARRRHTNSQAQSDTPLLGRPGDITAASIPSAEVRADLADLHIELSQGIAAVRTEMVHLRQQADEHFAAAQAAMVRAFDALRCELIDVSLRIDRLTEERDST